MGPPVICSRLARESIQGLEQGRSCPALAHDVRSPELTVDVSAMDLTLANLTNKGRRGHWFSNLSQCHATDRAEP